MAWAGCLVNATSSEPSRRSSTAFTSANVRPRPAPSGARIHDDQRLQLRSRCRTERVPPPAMKKRLVWLAVLVVLAAAASGVAYWRYRESHQPPEVRLQDGPGREAPHRRQGHGERHAARRIVTVHGRDAGLRADPEALRRLQLAGEEGAAHRQDRPAALRGGASQQARANYAPGQGGVVNARRRSATNADKQLRARRKALHEAEPRRAAGPRHRRGRTSATSHAARSTRANASARAGRGAAPPGAGEPLVHEHHLAHRRHRHLAQRRRRADGRGVAVRRRRSSRSPRT